MNIVIVILLVLAGVTFLLTELFLLPGFGIAGVAGLASLGGAVFVAYTYLTPLYPWAGHLTLLASILLTAAAVYWFLHRRFLEKMALDTTIDSHVTLAKPSKKIANLQAENNQTTHSEN